MGEARFLDAEDEAAVTLTTAIQAGDAAEVARLLDARPELATARIGDAESSRTVLHAATDWPGHFPAGPEIAALLVAAGADVNAPFAGPHTETPLHWAASTDDVAMVDALLDAGADPGAAGSVIDGGTPLADAVAFGQWNAARRLVERGARPNLWQAAALGDLDRVRALADAEPPPGEEEITNALWCACHGGRRNTAAFLLDRGGDPGRPGHDGLTPLQAAERAGADTLVTWLNTRTTPTTGARDQTTEPGKEPKTP
ncbi:ankyrin repeat domain-containing protein [Actinomadura roseirufa]|uniref:ankyrin repeat domain-containing protein n=1 Tax=Actinomadura roseirufa TaxID=2094049 RepID=UPI001A954D51|nr:ankyrin repeat domain-containing protein [Actinomadura roseirufa]